MTPSIETAKELRQADEDERRDDVYNPESLDHHDHALEIAQDIAVAGAEWVTLCASLRPVAARLARLEAAHRATAHLAGCNCVRPGARQDATEVLMAAVVALQPHTPFASQEAGEQAARRLATPCACTHPDPEV